ncbi:MAG: hypothetical protein R3256_13605, partial [Thalassovita sp.]|nr:hypothetical protein [Thalassovita sp.]
MLNDVDPGAKTRFPILSAISLLMVVAALVTLLLAGYGYRSEWWHFSTGVKLAERSSYVVSGGALVALLALVFERGNAGRAGTVLPLLALVIATPMLLLAAQWEYAARTTPPINDISTDTEDPPFFWDVPNPMDYPGEEAAALQHEFYPDIVPLETSATPEAAYAAALE